jgi:FAD/FMN-containing dehydrogenase
MLHPRANHSTRAITTQLPDADSEHEQDLFWALRGGGGSFGIVTAIEVELFPVKEVYAGIL